MRSRPRKRVGKSQNGRISMTEKISTLVPYTYEDPADYRIYSSGSGIYLHTIDGRRVLDGLAGSMNANLGHGCTSIAKTMRECATGLTSLPAIAGDVCENTLTLAEKLSRVLTEPGLSCIFTSSGSEATEAALAAVWKYWAEVGQREKRKILSLDHSYHGCTLGALALTGRADEHVDTYSLTPTFRLALPAWQPGDASRVSGALEEVLRLERPETVAAIFLEPIMGLAGMIPAPQDDIRSVVEICREHDILVVLDEALTGLGRAGCVTASQSYGIDYDILLISKGLGCGFVPIASTCIQRNVSSVLINSSPTLRHGHTSSGNPLSAAIASAVLDELALQQVTANARQMETVFKAEMLAALSSLDRDYLLRASGLCLALQTESAEFAREVRQRAFDVRLRIRAVDENIILAPPLVITQDQLRELVGRLHQSLEETERGSEVT